MVSVRRFFWALVGEGAAEAPAFLGESAQERSGHPSRTCKSYQRTHHSVVSVVELRAVETRFPFVTLVVLVGFCGESVEFCGWRGGSRNLVILVNGVGDGITKK